MWPGLVFWARTAHGPAQGQSPNRLLGEQKASGPAGPEEVRPARVQLGLGRGWHGAVASAFPCGTRHGPVRLVPALVALC